MGGMEKTEQMWEEKEEPAYGEKLQSQWRSSEIKEFSPLNTPRKDYKLEG